MGFISRGWDSKDNKKRSKILLNLPYSVIVEGAYSEKEKATNWCLDELDEKNNEWIDLWCGKTGYDYGFWEFPFLSLLCYNASIPEVDERVVICFQSFHNLKI